MVWFAYPSALKYIMECLAFVDRLCDHKIQRTFHLAHHKTLVNVFSAALKFKAATLASSRYYKVTTVKKTKLFHLIVKYDKWEI